VNAAAAATSAAASSSGRDKVTLGTLEQWYVLGGRCAKCGHKGWIDRWEEQRKRGKGVYVASLAAFLKCTGCQNRNGNSLTLGKLKR
jgi:hypothetical protein